MHVDGTDTDQQQEGEKEEQSPRSHDEQWIGPALRKIGILQIHCDTKERMS